MYYNIHVFNKAFFASNPSLGKFSSRVLPASLYDEKAESLSLVYDVGVSKDSYTFAEELQSFDSKLVVASFDTGSLFTDITLQETIDPCAENLFKGKTHVDNLSKGSFRELLTSTMSESLTLFDQEYYKQHHGVAMGSPLGPTLANVFLCYHEKLWLQNCPSKFKLVIYRRYVDDTFLLFRWKHHIEKFRIISIDNIEISDLILRLKMKTPYRSLTLK